MLRASLAIAAVMAGLTAIPASAVVRQKLDRDDGVRFHLDGRVLTVGLEPQENYHPSDARRELFGRPIRAVCGTSFNYEKATIAYEVRRWPKGRKRRVYELPSDVSKRVRWCLLEGADDGGGDVAFVKFD